MGIITSRANGPYQNFAYLSKRGEMKKRCFIMSSDVFDRDLSLMQNRFKSFNLKFSSVRRTNKLKKILYIYLMRHDISKSIKPNKD